MQGTELAALLLDTRERAHALLACAGRRLQSLDIGGLENAGLLRQQRLEVPEKLRLLTQQGRQMLATDSRVHELLLRQLREGVLELQQLIGDVLRLYRVGTLLDRCTSLRHARLVHRR